MKSERHVLFGPFRLDLRNEILWKGEGVILLQPKPFSVLKLLADRAGQLVTKEELLEAVWPSAHVSDSVLKVVVSDLRRALGDSPRAPRFIETAHRRGYRFIAEVRTAPCGEPSASVPPSIVGRERELEWLRARLTKTSGGRRQIVFVTGEPGIGKTALVEAFAREAAAADVWVAQGQCVEPYGGSEPYLPWLEALSRLAQRPRRERLREVLRSQAPTWMAQMPWLIAAEEREAIRRELLGATRERMLRELAEALETLTRDAPFLFVLEDLHWSDLSTVGLLSHLARRPEPARLLVIGTYRPADVIHADHPLNRAKLELEAHGRCEELPLEFLTLEAVREYLEARLPHSPLPDRLARLVHRRTDGNPLFVVSLLEHWIARGLLAEEEGAFRLTCALEGLEAGVPEGLQRMIEAEIDRLPAAERRVLEASAVAGVEFAIDAVAVGLDADPLDVEECCHGLARRRQFLRPLGSADWPDGTASPRFGFVHALYQSALYERLVPGRRGQLHLRIGERVETAYRERVGDVAAELGMHFERAADHRRAVRYVGLAAENAVRRFANREAEGLARRALDLLRGLPESAERDRLELALRFSLGYAVSIIQGLGDPEARENFIRAQKLSESLGDDPQRVRATWGLWGSFIAAREIDSARRVGEELLQIALATGDPAMHLGARTAVGIALLNLGRLVEALEHLERGVEVDDPSRRADYTSFYNMDIGLYCRAQSSRALWLHGCPDQARRRLDETVALARTSSDPRSVGYSLVTVMINHFLCGETREAEEQARSLIVHCEKYGMPQERQWGTMVLGCVLVAARGKTEEGIALIEESSVTLDEMRHRRGTIQLAMVADAFLRAGRPDPGLAAVAQGLELAGQAGERVFESELYRLRGELLLASRGSGRSGEAERSYLEALDVARRQGAKSLELRAAMSLCRLWSRQRRTTSGRELVAETLSWFREGADTLDLRRAKELLDELS